MADQEIEGLPEGSSVRALQPEGETAPPQPTGEKPEIEGLPSGSTVRALPPAPSEQSTAGAEAPKQTQPEPEDTAAKVWRKSNEPLIPAGRAEKEGKALSESVPTLAESEHPIWTGMKKGLAGAYADTAETARQFTSSPLALATMGLGKLGEAAPGALGKIAKYGSRMAGAGFGAQGAEEAVKGGEDIAARGVTPENVKQTLSGAGMAAMGGAGTAHGTELGEQPAKKVLAAPVRAASRVATPLSHIIPSVGGIAAADAAGIPHPFIVGGTLGRFLLPPAYLESIFERGRTLGLNDEEANITHLQDRYNKAVKDAKQPQKEFDAHQTGREQGIPAPDDVLKAHEKAQKNLSDAKEHLKAAQDDYAAKMAGKAPTAPDQPITPEAVEAARPEAPTPTKEQNDAKLSNLMEQAAPTEKPAPVPQNVKTPGQIQPETFPQTPTEAPRATMGKLNLPSGTMGKPRMLTEGTTEAVASPATPEAPKPVLGEILPPERPAKPGRLGTLRVGEGGKVVDTEPELQQKIEEGLQGTPKAKAVAPETPKAEAPKEEYTPEHETKVEQVVNQHTDQDLLRLAEKEGIDTSKYDFAKRDENRHRTERDQLVKDLMAKLSEKDKANIARLSDEFNSKDTTLWTEGERSNLSKAQRSRAIMQEHEGGLKTVAGGMDESEIIPESEDKPTTGKVNERGELVGTSEGAKADTDHMAQAKINKPNGTLSEQLQEAQRLKDEAKAPVEKPVAEAPKKSSFSPADKEEYFKAVHENPQAASLTSPEEMKDNRVFSNGKGVYYSIDPKGDIQALVNNSPSVGALPSAMRDAIANGGKTLDAWDLYLPKFYEKMGFENTDHVAYDADTYGPPSDALKDVWKKQGWKEDQPYPGVQHMKVTDAAIEKYGPKEPAAKAYKDMTPEEQEALAAKGQSGASGKMLTGDELIKKYGESEGDPAHTAFILPDGRGVDLPAGTVHDEMLGGKMTDKIPPREAFIAQGNIRIRPSSGKAGRVFGISVPESGITPEQLAHLNKMAPQMGSGIVRVEIGKPGGEYREIEYGKASSQLEQTLRDLVPVRPKDYPKGTPEVSGGSQAATAPAKELPEIAEKFGTAEENSQPKGTAAESKMKTKGTQASTQTSSKWGRMQS